MFQFSFFSYSYIRLTTFIAIFIVFHSQLHAQESKVVKRQGKCVNDLFKDIFESYPNVKWMEVEYINDIPFYLNIYKASSEIVNNKTKGDKQSLDFKFEGDIRYFSEEYKTALPVFSASKLLFFDKFRCCDADYKVITTIDEDSIKYDFVQYCPQGNINFDTRKYRVLGGGDSIVRQIEKHCEDVLKGTGLETHAFLQGIIEADGRLTDVQVIKAKHTQAEQVIFEQLRESGKSWFPAIQAGRPVRSLVKFYVKWIDGKCQIAVANGWYTPILLDI